VRGRVTTFDGHTGLGIVTADDGTDFSFHCVEIADGSRTINTGVTVEFRELPKLGRVEATAIRPIQQHDPT